MGQIAEIFNSSFMRGLAEKAEKEKYEKEFEYRDQRAKVEDVFKQMQYNKLLEQVDEQIRHNTKMENLSQLNTASNEFVGVGPDDPIMNHYKGISTISADEYKERAGVLSHADPNQRFVEKAVYDRYANAYNTEIINDRFYSKQEAEQEKAKALDVMANSFPAELYSAPQVKYNEKTVVDPTPAASPVFRGINRMRFFPGVRDTWNYLFKDKETKILHPDPITGNNTVGLLFDLNNPTTSATMSHTEKEIDANSVAQRANTIANIWNRQKNFVGEKGHSGYASGTSQTFNELIDLAFQANGRDIPLNQEAQTVLNSFRPIIASGSKQFVDEIDKLIGQTSSRLRMMKEDDPGYQELVGQLTQLEQQKKNPIAALDYIKNLYTQQFKGK